MVSLYGFVILWFDVVHRLFDFFFLCDFIIIAAFCMSESYFQLKAEHSDEQNRESFRMAYLNKIS